MSCVKRFFTRTFLGVKCDVMDIYLALHNMFPQLLVQPCMSFLIFMETSRINTQINPIVHIY
jgi:hypothetical protein